MNQIDLISLTRNEIFIKVRNHLLSQMEQAWEKSMCRYRTSRGLKCAIGALIPDELYNPEMEGGHIGINPLVKKLFNTEDLDLLSHLQEVHDGWFPEMWAEKLEDARLKYNLDG